MHRACNLPRWPDAHRLADAPVWFCGWPSLVHHYLLATREPKLASLRCCWLCDVLGQGSGVSLHFEAGEQLDIAWEAAHACQLCAVVPVRPWELPPNLFQALVCVFFVGQALVLTVIDAAGGGDIETRQRVPRTRKRCLFRCPCWFVGACTSRVGGLHAGGDNESVLSPWVVTGRRMLGWKNRSVSFCAAIGGHQKFVVAARDGAFGSVPALRAHDADRRTRTALPSVP